MSGTSVEAAGAASLRHVVLSLHAAHSTDGSELSHDSVHLCTADGAVGSSTKLRIESTDVSTGVWIGLDVVVLEEGPEHSSLGCSHRNLVLLALVVYISLVHQTHKVHGELRMQLAHYLLRSSHAYSSFLRSLSRMNT